MNKNILIIDDDEAIRKSFALALEDTGYNIESAKSGEEGVEKVQKKAYDLIFLDLKMPGIDGVETLRRIRKISANIPIYIVTAFHKEFFSQLKNAFVEGIKFEVLQKPVDSDQIVLLAVSILE